LDQGSQEAGAGNTRVTKQWRSEDGDMDIAMAKRCDGQYEDFKGMEPV